MKEPYLWNDQELIAWTNNSINELCEKTDLLVDSTTAAICQIAITAGAYKYALDSRIINILRAKIAVQTWPMTHITLDDLDSMSSNWEDTTITLRDTPTYFCTDRDEGYVTLYPFPVANGTLRLTVHRYPLVQLTTAVLEAQLELPFQYQNKLLDGILAQAYRKQDAETYRPEKSNAHLALWNASIEAIKWDRIKRRPFETNSPMSAFI
jgi:hypothetical protein